MGRVPRRHRGARRRPGEPQHLVLHLALVLALSLAWESVPASGAGNILEYNFTVGVMTLNPTCTEDRPSVVVNGQWPGPTIYASDGDTVMVHVFNNQSLPITLHWHGISQRGSQWYDGVPGVTQCAIKQGKTFTYIFRILEQWGTFWWHAHVAQLRNTLHGALIVQPPPNYAEPLSVPISGEFLFLGGDWYTQTAQQLTDMISKAPFPGYPLPAALHLNGGSLCTQVPFFSVRRKKWYRIRVINTAMWGSYNLKIENHTFLLHEAEGGYTTHKRLSSIDVYPGQSYSLILYTGQRASNYWIVLNPVYDVAAPGVNQGFGVLSYLAKNNGPVFPSSKPPDAPTAAEKLTNGPGFQGGLKSRFLNQALPSKKITKLIVLELNQNTQKSQQILYSLNNVTFGGVTTPFLLADYNNASASAYNTKLIPDLPPKGLPTQKDGPSKVGPGVIEIEYGTWVQVVWQNHDTPAGLHPWHLHGFNFWVVGQGTGRFNIARWNLYKYNLWTPPWRNTVTMFNNTWVAIRFKADNPGQWIFHCHLEQHADLGLATVLKVKYPKAALTSGPPPLTPPPTDYPSCK